MRKKKLKGAVLMMVLTVMTVLIILLAGSIAVVYSTNERIMRKYEESQAYYTARSILSTIVDPSESSSMFEDNKTTINGSYYYLETDTGGNLVQKTLNKTKQGRTLELDLYRVPISTVQDSDSISYNKWYDKAITNGVIPDTDQNYVNFYNKDDSALGSTYGNYLSQYMSSSEWKSTFQSGVDDVLTYEFETNLADYQSTNSGELYSNKLADAGTASVKMTIQVLERQYNLGAGDTFVEKFIHGNRALDHFKYKVNVSVMYNNEEITTSAVFENYQTTPPASSNAVVSLSDITGDDTVTAIGGGVSLYQEMSKFSNNTTTAGLIYLNGDLQPSNTDLNSYLDTGDLLFVRKKFDTCNNKIPRDHIIGNGAMIYAGEFVNSQDNALGSMSKSVNLFASKYTTSSSNIASGQYVYLFTDELDLSKISGDKFKDVTMPGSAIFMNPVYANNAILPGVYREESGVPTLYVGAGNNGVLNGQKGYVAKVVFEPKEDDPSQFKATISFDGESEVFNSLTGGLNIGTSITVNNGYGPVYYLNIEEPTLSSIPGISGSIAEVVVNPGRGCDKCDVFSVNFEPVDSNNNGSIDSGDVQPFTVNEDNKKVFVLPGDMSDGDNELELPTNQSLYNAYFKEKYKIGETEYDTFNEFGDFSCGNIMASENEEIRTAALKSAEDALQDNAVSHASITGASITNTSIDVFTTDVNEGYSGADVISGVSKVIKTDTMIEDSGISSKDANEVIAIDCREHAITLQLGDGTRNKYQFWGKYVVYGDKGLNIVLPASSVGSVSYELGTSGYDFLVYDTHIGSNPSTLVVGRGNNLTPAPKINIYASKDVTDITLYRNSIVQGYFYAPFSKFALGGGANGLSANVIYNTKNLGNVSYCVLGSVFCNGYGGSQKPGVVYIESQTDDIIEGDKLFTWSGVHYSR